MNINQIRFILKNKQKGISFYDDDHSYYYRGEKFRSVSSFIADYSEPFDPSGAILKRCAEKRGISQEELKAEWDKKAEDACKFGTEEHNKHEQMLWAIIPSNNAIKELLSLGYVMIDTETIFYDVEQKIAGQGDALLYHHLTNSVILIDWKTNKQIDRTNKYKKQMKAPFEDLSDDSLGHYTVQLNYYSYFLNEWGIKVFKLMIIHLARDGSFELIPINKIKDFKQRLKKIYNK